MEKFMASDEMREHGTKYCTVNISRNMVKRYGIGPRLQVKRDGPEDAVCSQNFWETIKAVCSKLVVAQVCLQRNWPAPKTPLWPLIFRMP